MVGVESQRCNLVPSALDRERPNTHNQYYILRHNLRSKHQVGRVNDITAGRVNDLTSGRVNDLRYAC